MEEHDWSFPILCDGAAVIASYGLTNSEATREDRKGIPHPATIIVDKAGVVRFVNVWVNYRMRTTPATILEELKNID